MEPLSLHPDALEDLRRSGLDDATIAAAGLYTPAPGDLPRLRALLGRQAMRRLSLSMAEGAGVAEAIEALEADANYFWAPTEKHVEHLARAVFRRSVTDREVRALCELVFRPGARRSAP